MLIYGAKHINIPLLPISSEQVSLPHALGRKLSEGNRELFRKYIFHNFVSFVPLLWHFLVSLLCLMDLTQVLIKLLFITFNIVILHKEAGLVEVVVGAPFDLNLAIFHLSLGAVIVFVFLVLMLFILFLFRG